ncbi:hypothetical protein AAVH_25021 [Aphelenchoides avenae]|nr:hypothetical protein AAVH_25021 [Aphelenchus avenae]
MPGDTIYQSNLRLAQNVICILCKTITIAVLSAVVSRTFIRRLNSKVPMSRQMWAFIWCHLLNCCYSITYHLYCAMLWRGLETRYDPYVLFWTGLGIDIYYGLSPIPLFFVTVDRLLTLLLPLRYSESARRSLFWTEIVTLIICTGICVGICVVELPLDEATAGLCVHVSCFMVKYHVFLILHMKTIFGVLSLLGSVVFVSILRRNKNIHVSDRMVRMTIYIEIFGCVIPGLVGLVYTSITNVNLAKYIGEFSTFLLAVDGTIFSVVYFFAFYRRSAPVVNVTTSG